MASLIKESSEPGTDPAKSGRTSGHPDSAGTAAPGVNSNTEPAMAGDVLREKTLTDRRPIHIDGAHEWARPSLSAQSLRRAILLIEFVTAAFCIARCWKAVR